MALRNEQITSRNPVSFGPGTGQGAAAIEFSSVTVANSARDEGSTSSTLPPPEPIHPHALLEPLVYLPESVISTGLVAEGGRSGNQSQTNSGDALKRIYEGVDVVKPSE